jgi:hypothetical protein
MICMIGYDSVEDTCISDDYRCPTMVWLDGQRDAMPFIRIDMYGVIGQGRNDQP